MALTEAQLAGITRMLNGDREAPRPPGPRGIEHMLSDMVRVRDDVKALVRIHEGITDANCTQLLQDKRGGFTALANELAAWVTPE